MGGGVQEVSALAECFLYKFVPVGKCQLNYLRIRHAGDLLAVIELPHGFLQISDASVN